MPTLQTTYYFVSGFLFYFSGRTAGRCPKYQSHKYMTDVVIRIKLTFTYIKLNPVQLFAETGFLSIIKLFIE